MTEQSDQISWSIRSRLPGRLRLTCPELVVSSLLRHHCAITLTCCHWIQGFRINIFSGSLVVHYPLHRQGDLDHLLKKSLTIPRVDDPNLLALAKLREHHWKPSEASTHAMRHGLNFGLLLLAEVVFPIPSFVMLCGTSLALLPVIKEVWQHWRGHHQLPPETLELAFSGILMSQGHTNETLLDLVLGDGTDAIAGLTTGESQLHAKSREFFDHVGNVVRLELVSPINMVTVLKDIRVGDRYRVNPHAHVYLTSTVIEGEVIVFNRLYNGDWRPCRVGVGDTVYAGALIIKGDAILEVQKALSEHLGYIQAFNAEQPGERRFSVEERLEQFNQALTPLLLAAGAVMFGLGGAERAIGLLQFTPINSWASTKTSARLTAISSLSIQGVHVNNVDALIALGKAKHIVISRSCLDKMGGIGLREHLQPNSDLKSGDLLRLLAGVQNYLLDTDDNRIWSDQLSGISDPVEVSSVALGDLTQEGWIVSLHDGRQLQICEQKQQPSFGHPAHLTPLEISEAGELLGHIELITQPDESWVGVCEALERLGIQVHVVAKDSHARVIEGLQSLRIGMQTHLHGNFNTIERLELVRTLQSEGHVVAYVGYLLCDVPALTLADVSISLDVDFDSAVTSGICDICLGADAHWLPRIIQLSRRLERTETRNFAMIAGGSLLTGVAAVAAWITPLPTVLLTNLPIILAELFNIQAMNSHGVFEAEGHHARALPAQEPGPLLCRLPAARPTRTLPSSAPTTPRPSAVRQRGRRAQTRR